MPLLTPWPPADRTVLVARSTTPGQVEIYPFAAHAPLPVIRFPLRKPDPDRVLDLQAVLSDVWRKGRFDLKVAKLDTAD